LTVLDVLRQGRKRIYFLNVEALTYLDGMPFSKATRRILEDWRSDTVIEEEIFLHELDIHLPGLNKQHRSVILSAAAVAACHAERGVSIVQTLMCDDAPQFKWLTRWLALCCARAGASASETSVSLAPPARAGADHAQKKANKPGIRS